jgi:hypothetical protein
MGISEAAGDLREMLTGNDLDREARGEVIRIVRRGEAAQDAPRARYALAWARTVRRATELPPVVLFEIVALHGAVRLVLDLANGEVGLLTAEHALIAVLGVYWLATWRSRREAALRAEAANRRVLERAGGR